MAHTTLQPVENALDSLRQMRRELEQSGASEIFRLKAVLAWGWQAVELLALLRLQAGRDRFDAWVQDYLHEVEAPLQIERDAHWEERERLSLLALLDLLSEDQLPLLNPRFYRGWQDPTVRCRGLRRQIGDEVGRQVNAAQREQLLLLLATYHRLMWIPAEVTLDLNAVRAALPALLELIAMLFDSRWPENQEAGAVLAACRQALNGQA